MSAPTEGPAICDTCGRPLVEPHWRCAREKRQNEIYQHRRRMIFHGQKGLMETCRESWRIAGEQALEEVRRADQKWRANQAKQERSRTSGHAF